jgi:exopolysaccharide production protein ExoQ
MEPLTRPIRVVFDTKSWDYRSKTWLAYLAVFGVACGDTLRYALGWTGFWIWCGVMFLAVAFMLIKSKPMETIKRIPVQMVALYVALLFSALFSDYQGISFGAVGVSMATASLGLWLAHAFDWRHLLRVFANVLRFALVASLLFELYAAILGTPIYKPFKNFEWKWVPDWANQWTEGNLFTGERIQGIVGNANLLAYLAMIGLVVFGVEYAVLGTSRWLSVLGLVSAGACVALSKSAGIGFALLAMVAAAAVSIAAEGKPYETRHRYYRFAWAAAAALAFLVFVYRSEIFGMIGKTPDMSGRTMIWRKVLGLIGNEPLTGYGWLSYWMPHLKPYEGLVKIDYVPYYQAHNAFLDMWLQGGMIAAGLLVALVVVTFVRLWQLAVRHTSALYLWPILVFVGLVVQNFTESRLLSELGWVMLTMFAVKVRDPEEWLEPLGRSPKRVRLLYQGLLRNRLQPRKDR